MTRDRGSAGWFKREKFQLIEQLKAIDSFAAAARSFQTLVQMGDDSDTEVRSALHTAAVVHYGRPFSNNRSAGGARFALGVIKKHAKYDGEIHRQLIVLRNKLIAHSDHDYADGRLYAKNFTLERGSEQFEVIVGATLVTQTVHMLLDMPLAERCLMHVKAAEEAAHTDLQERLGEFVKAGQQCPAAFKAARSATPRPSIRAGTFNLSPNQPSALLPNVLLNPHAVLTLLFLTIVGGYAYRGYGVQVDVSTTVSWKEDDGSEGSVAVAVMPNAEQG